MTAVSSKMRQETAVSISSRQKSKASLMGQSVRKAAAKDSVRWKSEVFHLESLPQPSKVRVPPSARMLRQVVGSVSRSWTSAS